MPPERRPNRIDRATNRNSHYPSLGLINMFSFAACLSLSLSLSLSLCWFRSLPRRYRPFTIFLFRPVVRGHCYSDGIRFPFHQCVCVCVCLEPLRIRETTADTISMAFPIADGSRMIHACGGGIIVFSKSRRQMTTQASGFHGHGVTIKVIIADAIKKGHRSRCCGRQQR